MNFSLSITMIALAYLWYTSYSRELISQSEKISVMKDLMNYVASNLNESSTDEDINVDIGNFVFRLFNSDGTEISQEDASLFGQTQKNTANAIIYTNLTPPGYEHSRLVAFVYKHIQDEKKILVAYCVVES